jgi:hypothetical protein
MDMLEYRLRRAADIENHHQLPEMAVLATSEFGAVEIGSSLVALVLAFLEDHAVGEAKMRMVCKTFERVAGFPTTECLTLRFTNLPASTFVTLRSFTHYEMTGWHADFHSVKSKIVISRKALLSTMGEHLYNHLGSGDMMEYPLTIGDVFTFILDFYEVNGKSQADAVKFLARAAKKARDAEGKRAQRKEEVLLKRKRKEEEGQVYQQMVLEKMQFVMGNLSGIMNQAPTKELAAWAGKTMAKRIEAQRRDVARNWSQRARIESATRRVVFEPDEDEDED